MVSYSVTPMCRKMLLSSTMPQKHSAILEGLLKIKESMIPTFVVNSQIKRKLKKNQNSGNADDPFMLLMLRRYFSVLQIGHSLVFRLLPDD